MEHDIFISHASEDKETFVKPFAELLVNLELDVWHDEFSLEVGDSLSRSIDIGLAKSKFGIVVLSRNFITKPWPEYELRGLVSKELGREKVILPIWHGISREEVLAFSPPLADKFALSTEKMSLQAVALKIVQVVRPDIFKSLQLMAWWRKLRSEARVEMVSLGSIPQGPVRQETLPTPFLIRVNLVSRVLSETNTVSFEALVNGFKRDINPNEELHIWEKIAATYAEITTRLSLTLEAKREVLSELLTLSMGMFADEGEKQLKHLSYEQYIMVAETFLKISQLGKAETKLNT